MATYKISAAEQTGYRAEATNDGRVFHVCGGLATEEDAQLWVAAHRRATEAESRSERAWPPRKER